MKMLVPNATGVSLLRGNNTPYTFNVLVFIIRTYSISDTSYRYTIKYPDGTSASSDATDSLAGFIIQKGRLYHLGLQALIMLHNICPVSGSMYNYL